MLFAHVNSESFLKQNLSFLFIKHNGLHFWFVSKFLFVSFCKFEIVNNLLLLFLQIRRHHVTVIVQSCCIEFCDFFYAGESHFNPKMEVFFGTIWTVVRWVPRNLFLGARDGHDWWKVFKKYLCLRDCGRHLRL
jgi:hypothetical protein